MRRPALIALLLGVAVPLAGCGSDHETTEITVNTTGKIDVVVQDLPPRGSTPGDRRAFSWRLVTPDGKPAGRLDGSVTITRHQRTANGVVEYRIGTVQFFLDGGKVLIGGEYAAAPGEPAPKMGIERPIIGGTGKYEHATGTATQRPIGGGQLTNILDIRTPKD